MTAISFSITKILIALSVLWRSHFPFNISTVRDMAPPCIIRHLMEQYSTYFGAANLRERTQISLLSSSEGCFRCGTLKEGPHKRVHGPSEGWSGKPGSHKRQVWLQRQLGKNVRLSVKCDLKDGFRLEGLEFVVLSR